jgi:hypothetical protein
MSAAEVDALLERLVAQFESPYDFLRELVQNAMDAGSDRVEVTLACHGVHEGGGDDVVFELSVIDAGSGMDEAIIDQELTRLFASGKSGDRTMAGGFGIGFVSVFAWEPEAVLVHTGRAGESWELLFHADRSFEKVAVEQPFEGTTVVLFRRGHRSERSAIADAIRESLWRWCRFCPLELSFEDLESDEPAELIQDSPEPAELGLSAGLSRTEVRGESSLRVSFAVPPNAVFLRRGLILAEGGPTQLLADARALGQSVEHLQIWADSPLLRTSLARDKVLDDDGRKNVEQRLVGLLVQLRQDLLERIEQLAATGEGALDDPDDPRVDPRWTHERHAVYGSLHAHLQLEAVQLGKAVRTRALLRDLAHARAISLDTAVARMSGRPLLLAPPPPAESSTQDERAPIVAGIMQMVAALRPTQLPVLAGELGDDRVWLEALAGQAKAELLPIERALAWVVARKGEAAGLCGAIESLLRGLALEPAAVGLGEFLDVQRRPAASAVFGTEVLGAKQPIVFHGGRLQPIASLRRSTIWLNVHNTLVEAAIACFPGQPLLAALGLAYAIVGQLDEVPELSELAKLAEALQRDARAGGRA